LLLFWSHQKILLQTEVYSETSVTLDAYDAYAWDTDHMATASSGNKKDIKPEAELGGKEQEKNSGTARL